MEHQFWKLQVWKRSVDFATEIYALTKSFPQEEKYGLTNLIRRCSVSIPSNIAKGSSRNTNKNFIYFLSLSRGSIYELQTQFRIALNLSYISKPQYSKLHNELIELSNMIYKFGLRITNERTNKL